MYLKRWIRFGSVGLVVALIAVLVLTLAPAQVSITGEGGLSIDASVALAVNSPPGSVTAGQAYGVGEEGLTELVWMRTKNSKVLHSYTLHRDYHDIYLDAVHYEVGHEREIETLEGYEIIYWATWEDIDNTLEPAGELSPWDWKMVKADYNAYILEDFTYGQILKFEKADPYGTVLGDVAFQPMALQWTNDLDQIQQVSMPQSGILSVVDNRIGWEDAYGPDIDFEWICYSTRLIKLLTISSLSALPPPEQFILDGGNPVLELNLIFDPSSELDIYVDGSLWDKKSKVQTFGIVEFKLGGTTLWGFMPLWAWDSAENEIEVTQRLRRAGNKLYVSVRVPYEWIQSAVFPVYIDTVVDEQVEMSSDDAHEVASSGSMDLTDAIVDLGSYTGGPTHAGFRFTRIDTTDVKHVAVAYLEFYPAQNDSGAVSYTWYGEDVASAATFTAFAYDISNRTRTTACITENPPANWSSGTWMQTSDLSDILNEVFSRGDWVSGNDLAILNVYDSGNGERRLRSWDYNDHGKAPKLHFENPTETTYYFDAYDVGTVWETTPEYMVDNVLTNYASTNNDNEQEKLTETNGPGTDLGTITKVELRAYGNGDGNDRIDFSFDSGQSPEYQVTMPSSPDWSSYVDVTDDTNVGGWTWAKVQNPTPDLWVQYDKSAGGNILYCAKVEIRVTYADIDVGADPINRNFARIFGYTSVDKNNPANASGTLHSVKVYANINISGLIVGTFYLTNGNTLKCRDSELIGNVEAGAVRTFTELSITVVAGDYIGCYYAGGYIEWDSVGFAGRWTIEGEYIDPNDEAEYTFLDGDAISLYGYGDIVVGADISNTPSTWSVNSGTPVATSTDYWSSGSEPSWPLDDGECHFTVTNNGDTCSITVKGTNFTGGVGWTLAGTPAENTVTMKAGKSGDALEANMVVLTTSEQSFISGLAGSATKKWELLLESATSHTDGAGKTGTVTLTATLD